MLSIRQDLFRMKYSHVAHREPRQRAQYGTKIEAGIISQYLQFLCYRYGQVEYKSLKNKKFEIQFSYTIYYI